MFRSAREYAYVFRRPSSLTVVVIERWDLGFMHRIPTVVTLQVSRTAGQGFLLRCVFSQRKATNIIEDLLGL
jgi:hypothetical protein